MITEITLKQLPDSEQRLDAIFQAFDDLLFILDEDGRILDYKTGDAGHLYLPPSQFLGRKMQEVLPMMVGRKFAEALLQIRSNGSMVQIEYSLDSPMGPGWYESRLLPLANEQIAVFVRNITKFKQSEIKITNQLEQLAALRAIDLAITSGMDLNLTLLIILEHVRKQLNIDAAAVLLLNQYTRELEFAAAAGFNTLALQETRLRVGQSYAGRAVLEQHVVYIPDLRVEKAEFSRSPHFASEQFVAYYSIPLLAKGQVLGVLEIFHRAPIEATSDWQNFANTLAGQAAIAIDNAMLFKNLQMMNIELTLAYDKTIEGWARALALRDAQTDADTQRVTEMTVRLARQLGIPETELQHIRRGAILHDIGKVGIPDSILRKPEALDDGEWELMRRHPLIAVELLKSVPYLVAALPIPRSHHEKWDGSGYPDGLAGEYIPIAARVFAVVDVYDALTSDRPYRAAWPKAEALGYIREQAGKHFDPSVVPAFVAMMANEGPVM